MNKLGAFLKNNSELTDEETGRICDVVKESDLFTISHEGPMRTYFSRTKSFKEMFRYTEPVKLYLGTDETRSQRFAYYVPVKDTLRCLLESDLWQKCAAQDTCLPCTDVLCDVSDGQVYKNNEFFSENPSCLKLILYQDSFEVVNPLGSAKSKHKVLAVYLSLANLPPHIRSNTDHMSLVMLCREKDFKHFGHDKVFSRLTADLKDLEDLCFTLSERLQMFQAYLSEGSMCDLTVRVKNCTAFYQEPYGDSVKDAVRDFGFTENNTKVSADVMYRGTLYKKGQFLVTNNMDSVEFGELALVLMKDEVVHFLLRRFVAEFIPEYHLHELENHTEVMPCVKINDLADFYPLTSYVMNEKLVIPLKHSVMSH